MAVSLQIERQDVAGATLRRVTNGESAGFALSVYVPLEIDRAGYPTSTRELLKLGIQTVDANRRLDIVMNPHQQPELEIVYIGGIRDVMEVKSRFFRLPNKIIHRLD